MSAAPRWFLGPIVALALVAPVSAQQNAPGGLVVVPLPGAWATTPVVAGLPAVDTELILAPAVAPLTQIERQRQPDNVVMMIVGGGALVVGSLIDGDTGTIIMAGGGVLGLVGLFRYLR